MTDRAGTEQVTTRPTPRIVVLAVLTLLLYAAGANVGAGPVLLLSAGMAVGTAWSVTGFLRRVDELRVLVEPTCELVEGTIRLPMTVTVPRGVIGVLGLAPVLPPQEASRLLGLLGQRGTSGAVAADAARDGRWVTLPRSGTSGSLAVPAVLARGDAQPLRIRLEVTDVFGLVRRRWTLTGPLAEVLPARGAASAFDADTVEGPEDDHLPHALAANGTPGTELRPWRPGEAIRAVHWSASERAAQLLVRPRGPETQQRRTLTVEDADWTRTALDARCRDLTATADRLVGAGVEVEVAAAGEVLPWGHDARRLLASLRPNASSIVPSIAPSIVPASDAVRG